MDVRSYDVVVIGAGPTGENVADRVVKGGLTAAIVEAELVGGECSYWACIPSKAMLRPLEALDAASSVEGSREAVGEGPDHKAVFHRRDSFVSSWKDDGQARWLEENKIDLLRGHGRIIGERRVLVADTEGRVTELNARRAVAVCTGSRAAIPELPGIEDASPWTSRDATGARDAPRRLAVLGGGPVACEMATAWNRLGAEEITLVERGARLLGRLEPFAGDAVRESLEKRGVRVLTGTTVHKVERFDERSYRLSLDRGEKIVADRVLAAAGRKPRTEDIGLEKVGLKPGSWLEVDDSMRVRAVPAGWLYAAGDVNHRALLTHMGKYQARVCGDAIVARAIGRAAPTNHARWTSHSATADHEAVPQVIFTEPQVAAVGLTESEAKSRGIRVRTAEYAMGNVSGASLYADGYRGHAKMVVDESRGVVLGVTLVGPAVAELLHAATVAIVGEVPLARLWHAVPSFPTISEIYLRLLEGLGL